MPMHIFILKGLRREVGRKARTEDGRGITTLPDGHEFADIELALDLESIARQLGPKAMKNKSGKAKFMHGDIVATARNKKRVR